MQKFSEMPYERPDLKAFSKALKGQIKAFKKAADYAAAKKCYLDLQKLESNLITMVTICHVRHTMNMSDAFYDKEQTYFDRNLPKVMSLTRDFSEALLKTPFRADFEKEYGKHLFTQAEMSVKTQSLKIVPLMIKENTLTSAYSKKAAACKTSFRGEDCNFYGLLKHMQSPDREERKAAFFAWADLYASVSGELDDIYSKLVALRQKKAKKLGFDRFIQLGYMDMGRSDWNEEDVKGFRKQVQEIIVPACLELLDAQKKRIGVDKLRYYDEAFRFVEGNPTPSGTKDEMVGWAGEMYHALSPETGEFFDFMTKYELFDLETRRNKHLGGYMTLFPDEKAPFIFSNFNGTSADVDVLTHEAGHAFQGYLGCRHQELSAYWSSTSEVNEIHSMAMEFFAYPWMDKFFGEDADRYRYAHLSDCLLTIPYLVMVDEFQERVYESGNPTAEERYAIWKELEGIYLPGRDYDGHELMEKGGFWMQKQHIFLYPFYYVDYALAEICAMQLYVRNKQGGNAWQDYLNLCHAGGSKPYKELLEVANLASPFAEGTVKAIVEPLMEELRASKYHLGE